MKMYRLKAIFQMLNKLTADNNAARVWFYNDTLGCAGFEAHLLDIEGNSCCEAYLSDLTRLFNISSNKEVLTINSVGGRLLCNDIPTCEVRELKNPKIARNFDFNELQVVCFLSASEARRLFHRAYGACPKVNDIRNKADRILFSIGQGVAEANYGDSGVAVGGIPTNGEVKSLYLHFRQVGLILDMLTFKMPRDTQLVITVYEHFMHIRYGNFTFFPTFSRGL